MACNLIVHGDDFGLSEKVNEGILQAYRHGILTSTSIMANGAAFEHAINICQSTPTLDVGIHLTLVEEKPLLEAENVPTLLNIKGKFHHHAMVFAKRYLSGKISPGEVYRELETQINSVINQGISLSHIDSHQHLHMLPQIWCIAIALAKKYHIPAIRVPYERFRAYMFGEMGSLLTIPRLVVLNSLTLLKKSSKILQSDYFFGFFFGGNLNKRNLKKVLHYLPCTGVCELMCHPGLDDPDSRYAHWGYHWSEELSALTDPVVSNLISSRGIKIISYRDLPQIGRHA
jgi:hopanoid biosynthesis associated protein HpnK